MKRAVKLLLTSSTQSTYLGYLCKISVIDGTTLRIHKSLFTFIFAILLATKSLSLELRTVLCFKN